MATFKSTLASALAVQEIVEQHYEPGRHDRCKRWVYRNFVRKKFRISERTFFRYLKITPQTPAQADPEDKRQLSLF